MVDLRYHLPNVGLVYKLVVHHFEVLKLREVKTFFKSCMCWMHLTPAIYVFSMQLYIQFIYKKIIMGHL